MPDMDDMAMLGGGDDDDDESDDDDEEDDEFLPGCAHILRLQLCNAGLACRVPMVQE